MNKQVQTTLLIAALSNGYLPSSVAIEPVEDPATEPTQSQESRVVAATVSDPELRWQEYLNSRHLREGPNDRDGRLFFLTKGVVRVGKPFGAGWIRSRNVAFEKAVLLAKSEMAEFVGASLSSDRRLELLSQGGEAAPEMEKALSKAGELSIVKKINRLSHEVLDDLIRKYEPSWTGKDVSVEEKREKLVNYREVFRHELRQKARLFLQGATPVFNAEGPNIDGHYTVVVGLAWSMNLAGIAESLLNPNMETATLSPGDSVREQIGQMLSSEPNALSAFQGVRIWRNELGQPVLVSAAAEERSGNVVIVRRKAALRARAQMARFVAENIESRSALEGGETFDLTSGEKSKAFDESEFNERITAKSKQVKLVGSHAVYTWSGPHPISRSKMHVTVMLWSPRYMRDAERLAQKYSPVAARVDGSSQRGIAAGGLSGPQSSTDFF